MADLPPIPCEVQCISPACPFNPPPSIPIGPYRHLLHVEHVDDIDAEKCPACGLRTLKLTQPWPRGRDVKFPLGNVRVTAGFQNLMELSPTLPSSAGAFSEAVEDLTTRHQSGDWGDALDAHDRAVNDDAIKLTDGTPNGRVFSAYMVKSQKVWVITERGRHETTILLPEEY